MTPDDFPAFFREVNGGNNPFPWQQRLARQVFNEGWPSLIDIPTGAGKTAVLEIALFHLALEARIPSRRAPVRIAFVVDRRLIVDQAQKRAEKIQSLLAPQASTVAGQVAKELSFLAGAGSQPLTVSALRGGIPREYDWARTPVQPAILLSTVDQVGSRLLFRGYGVSSSMAPIHAGLLGSDCLIFLDEAHLSEPFRQTLGWVNHYRKWSKETPAPWSVVTMSATPGPGDTDIFRLRAEEDLKDEILGRRLEASKPAELREIPVAGLPERYADAARELAKTQGIEKVLIVVNRVDLARSIFNKFTSDDNRMLLTGRVRELDRKRIVRSLEEKLIASGKLFVVATQCIEAGADYDFDALVTQAAPLDSLRQRFGRLNRTGRQLQARAMIIASKDDLSKKPDPIYNCATKEAWALLHTLALPSEARPTVDFGSLSLREKLESLDPAQIGKACCEKLNAPVIPPAYIDVWTCTSPRPLHEPEIALFLHGPQRASADVEIVWRADITLNESLTKLTELLYLIPPCPQETLSAPIWSVKKWLAGSPEASHIGDTEGEIEPGRDFEEQSLPVLRWRGADDAETRIIRSNQIRPGDVIVVPASYGGSDEWGWTGLREPAVSDLAPAAERRHPNLLSNEEWARVLNQFSENPDDLDIAFYYTSEDHPEDGFVLLPQNKPEEPSTESDRIGSSASRRVTLSDHTSRVAAYGRDFASHAIVTPAARLAIGFSADLHDSGKADRRFQRYLYNGGEGPQIIAKSGLRYLRPDPELKNWRHEALSVRIAMQHSEFLNPASEMDRELALWLIGVHHGHGRPFFSDHDDSSDDRARVISDAAGVPIHLNASPGPHRGDFDWNGSDWPTLFDVLKKRYGAWELARMEAILRLADHRASAEEKNAANTQTAGSGTR